MSSWYQIAKRVSLSCQPMRLRILIVERDLSTADLLIPSLERKGYEVCLASTQRQVNGSLRSFRPDLLVVDIASFGSKGYRFCDSVRSRLEGTPCILMVQGGHASLDGLGEEFITPPFTSRKLLYKVKKVAEKLTAREIQAGPLALDLQSQILRNGDQVHHLRPKEAELLATLMRNAGRVVSRKEMMRTVWQTEYLGDTRTLTVHIRWLRLKIEQDPNRPVFLRTVRGVGYRFDVPQPLTAR
jgi:two-component system alkaline phosphatase synthesis response regulator PhoP